MTRAWTEVYVVIEAHDADPSKLQVYATGRTLDADGEDAYVTLSGAIDGYTEAEAWAEAGRLYRLVSEGWTRIKARADAEQAARGALRMMSSVQATARVWGLILHALEHRACELRGPRHGMALTSEEAAAVAEEMDIAAEDIDRQLMGK